MSTHTFDCDSCGEDLTRRHKGVITVTPRMFCDTDCAVQYLLNESNERKDKERG